ncbi:hypothetical protein MD535_16405 [Vibrio sp. ZSDZ65]|uniref:Uncharacterized protein n=1 Tax=Vibrio qingdaonensis TaxID=2829491 RepID=A0A9X3HXR6_9VIBR|nr:hypothetical protein [Vibrio qingdaonensis]MCW8347584.1 hypothetical protein [Vibrio qingdaonensis]
MQEKHKHPITLWAEITSITNDSATPCRRIKLEDIVVNELIVQYSSVIEASLQACSILLIKEHRELCLKKINNAIQTKEKEHFQSYSLLNWGIDRPTFHFARFFNMKQNWGISEDHISHPDWLAIHNLRQLLKNAFNIEVILDFIAEQKEVSKAKLPLVWAICCLLAKHSYPAPITTKSPISMKHLALYMKESEAETLEGVNLLKKLKLIKTNGAYINIKPLFWVRGIKEFANSTYLRNKTTFLAMEDNKEKTTFFNQHAHRQLLQAQDLAIQLLQELGDDPLLTTTRYDLSTFLSQTLQFNHEYINENLFDL